MHDLGFLSVRIQLGNSLGFQQREFNEGFGHIGDERTQQPNRGWGGAIQRTATIAHCSPHLVRGTGGEMVFHILKFGVL